MKTLRKLFALYITALLLFPCSDTLVCTDEGASVAQHEGTVEKDICTPFCICQCCRTAVEEIDGFNWITPEIKPVDTWNEFLVRSPKTSPHNIWQPPRIA